jgi:hypothetical protein
MKTSGSNNVTRKVGITVALKFENCNMNVTAGKIMQLYLALATHIIKNQLYKFIIFTYHCKYFTVPGNII